MSNPRSRAYCFNMDVHPLCGFYSFTRPFYMVKRPKTQLSQFSVTLLALWD